MTKPIALDRSEELFVAGLVATGRFDTAGNAVKEALRLLHDREARLTELRDAWIEGVESGDYQPADEALAALSSHYAALAKPGV